MNLYLKDIDKFKKVLLIVTVFSLLLIVLSIKNYYDTRIKGNYGYNIIYPEGKNIKLNSLNTSTNKIFEIVSFNNTNKDIDVDLVLNIKNENLDLDKVKITLSNNDKEYNITPKNGSFIAENIILKKGSNLSTKTYELNIKYLDSEPVFGDIIEDSIGIIEDDSNLELSIDLK